MSRPQYLPLPASQGNRDQGSLRWKIRKGIVAIRRAILNPSKIFFPRRLIHADPLPPMASAAPSRADRLRRLVFGVVGAMVVVWLMMLVMSSWTGDRSEYAPAIPSELGVRRSTRPVATEREHDSHEGHRHAGTLQKPIDPSKPQLPTKDKAGDAASASPSVPMSKLLERLQQQRQQQGQGQAQDEIEFHDDHLQPDVQPVDENAYFDDVTRSRQQSVKDAFLYAWNAYDRKCWGQDELKPVSGGCNNWLNQGLTITDSLDTMWIMGLKEQFNKAKEWVRNSLSFNRNLSVSFFETTIRSLGGLLSAFALSKEAIFLDKALELGERLLPAFNTPTGIPKASINLQTGMIHNPAWAGDASILAEIGTVQMEFDYLSQLLPSRPEFRNKAHTVIERLQQLSPHLSKPGLYPIYLDPNNGGVKRDIITMGAMGDSFYEYLLKMWLLKGKTPNDIYQQMYIESTRAIRQHLYTKSQDGYWFLADLNQGRKDNKMDHLVCFAPGMFALGAHHGIVEGEEREMHLEMAKELMRTCYESYSKTPTGIGPEFFTFKPNMQPGDASYHLRPEMVESLFVLWRVTHDPLYREWGWKAFEAIEKHCKVPNGGGYAGLNNVHSGHKDDRMESFFLAETLKYFYMLFSPDSVMPITADHGGDYWVFNTECHPLPAYTNRA